MAIYKPLQSGQHIRLLRVPASPTATAGQLHLPDSQLDSSGQGQYELVHFPLATCQTPYQAISYVWGDNTQHQSLEINGQHSLPITKILATALPYLVQMCSTGYLWIDQICIDQSNNEERSEQVAIMGEIFKNAMEVLIWTGGEPDGFAEMTAKLAPSEAFERNHIETLVQLICRPWFTRGWTVQEAVLAKRARLVAGTSSRPLEQIGLAWLNNNSAFTTEQRERIQIARHSLAVTLALRKSPARADINLGLLFDSLLNTLGNTQTSDPRDHVYAFLGLNKDHRIIIRPDYNASISEVFSHATRAIIEGTRTLDCFRFLPRDQRTEGFTLPSWVPDWSRTNSNPESRGIVPWSLSVTRRSQHPKDSSTRAEYLHCKRTFSMFRDVSLTLLRLGYRLCSR